MGELNALSLFSGIDGLGLGLQRAGMTIVGHVELDPFCRRVLAHHWPEAAQHDDVRTAVQWWQSADRPRVDVVAGGFPCQPFAKGGRRRGTADGRWGWPWMARVVRALRPRYVVVENVAALLDDGEAFGWVLADLAACGFDAEWSVLTACCVGAPHVRPRLFLVAYPDCGDGSPRLGIGQEGHPLQPGDGRASTWADPIDGIVEAHGYGLRVADGVSAGLEPARVKALGNAVVPQLGEYIGRLIVTHERKCAA